MPAAPAWAECPGCGKLQVLPVPAAHHVRRCDRCGYSFGHGLLRTRVALALGLTALILFTLANLSPLMGIELAGRGQSVRLTSGIGGLTGYGMLPLSLFVLLISVVAPLGRVLGLCIVLLALRSGRLGPALARVMWLAERLRSWAMLDVLLVGTLVALTKLHDLARVQIGVGLWSLGLLVLTLAAFELAVDRRALWDQLQPPAPLTTVSRTDCIGCGSCGLVQRPATRCARCHVRLHRRKPASMDRTAALVLTGLILYLPANLYPVLTVVSFGRGASATIFGGVVELLDGSDWPLAVIVFTASVAVPLLKLVGLAWLLLSTRLSRRRRLADRTRLYRLIELVSRWSAVDIFVAALLTALVTLGNLATTEPGLGVLAFGAVVFVTMVATECFDTRLMWDVAGANDA